MTVQSTTGTTLLIAAATMLICGAGSGCAEVGRSAASVEDFRFDDHDHGAAAMNNSVEPVEPQNRHEVPHPTDRGGSQVDKPRVQQNDFPEEHKLLKEAMDEIQQLLARRAAAGQ